LATSPSPARGPSGTTLEIGIEYKKLGEMMTSIRDGRFSGHQLPGMLGEKGMYDYGFLLIEGEWRIDDDGFLTTLQFRRGKRPEWKRAPGNMRASEYEKHLLTYQLCGGVHVRHARNQADSVRIIADLYRWWTDRAIDEHTSHLAQHRPAFLSNVSAFRRAIAAWPGVGLKWSKAVEAELKGLDAEQNLGIAANWGVPQWAGLSTTDNKGNTRRFGEANARKLVKFLQVSYPITRTWAMPNSETFSIKPIGQLVQRYISQADISIDPFARNKSWATLTNDLNPNTSAEYHLEAVDFLNMLHEEQIKADLVIIDPPYSPRQVKECYDGFGR
jgi:hypothetical protein